MKSLRSIVGFSVLGVTSLAGGSIGCVHEQAAAQTMTTSANVPSGQGTIQATRTDNGNTALSVHVKHLAPPSKVAPDASVYVLWVKPPNGTIQNAGAMNVDADLAGSLDTVTPYTRFKVMITPEPGPEVSQPSHAPVLTSDVTRSQ